MEISMNRSARVMTLVGALVLASSSIFVGCGAGEAPSTSSPATSVPIDKAPTARDLIASGSVVELPSFSLTDQTGARFGLTQLDGRVWIAHLTFTRCREACPEVTAALRTIQTELKSAPGWEDVRLVSISVDPQHDTPQVLLDFARDAGADPEHWKFLTGRPNQIWQLSRHGLRLPVEA